MKFSEWLKSKLTGGVTGEIFAQSCPEHEVEGHKCLIMSRASVYHYLEGRRRPNLVALQKIAAKLGIEVSTIMTEVSDLSLERVVVTPGFTFTKNGEMLP
jgi:transcriptional regulator with XRE-family HTH domain